MSRDRSLKTSGNLSSNRSVLSRAERIAKMVEDKKMTMEKGKALGLPKTLVPKG